MVNNNIHIVIIEPSTIVYEGLSNILGYSDSHFSVSRLDRLDDITNYTIRKSVDVILINPAQVQNNLKTYNTIRNGLSQTKCIGIVYSYFDQHLLSLFDEIISVFDTPESIIGLVQRTADQNEDTELNTQEKITERETEVLKLLTAGNSNKEIADQLNISIHTVISHRKNLSQKTGIKSVSGLTIYAVVNNIITLDNFKE
ncbi:MAG: response regulator transcription factor [Mariniphaga sp.]|nr:response regulator transcription factor [Mariniphaga sp.]